ncbi:MAG: PIN domain nuclease [Lactobacillaceae bacterium]|jgi:uncharacterized protein YacL|nr:PIN domain nuclease [Lactobacillaceae bacterium]
MRKRIIQIAFVIAGSALAVTLLPLLWDLLGYSKQRWVNNPITDVLLGAIIFFLLSFALWRVVDHAIRRIEAFLNEQPPLVLLVGSLSMIIALVLAVLITLPLQQFHNNFFVSAVVPGLVMLLFAYFGFRIGTTRIDDLVRMVTLEGLRTRINKPRRANSNSDVLTDEETNYHHYKILDTNILIDGRIVQLVKTGWVEGTLLVPNFVLYELQYIADEGDALKRVRGRRGLDILNELRDIQSIPLEMWEGDYDDIKEVDEKLIQLAKDINGILVTNDYNLNKVTSFQNVEVLNLNELAGALRTSVVVGDHLHVQLVKKGTERSQAVGYLDDGTMVVVEDGQEHLQAYVEVEVTSSLQTDAGRMIFGNYLQ